MHISIRVTVQIIYKFDNSVVASGNELTYYPYQGVNNDAWNQFAGVFSLMRLVEGEKLTLLIERLMQDGTAKELYRSDLVELIRMQMILILYK